MPQMRGTLTHAQNCFQITCTYYVNRNIAITEKNNYQTREKQLSNSLLQNNIKIKLAVLTVQHTCTYIHKWWHMYLVHIPSDLDAQVSGVSLLHVTSVLAPIDDKSKAALIRQIKHQIILKVITNGLTKRGHFSPLLFLCFIM